MLIELGQRHIQNRRFFRDQPRRDLRNAPHRDGQLRLAGHAVIERGLVVRVRLAERDSSAPRGELGEHLSSHRVDAGRRKHQTRVYHRAHHRAVIRRAARFFEPRLQIVRRQRVHQRLLRHGADCLAHVPVVILRGQLRGLVRTHHRVEFDAHTRALARFIRCSCGGEELLVALLLLPRAEHVLSGLSLIIALREALPGEDGLELLHVFLRDALAVDGGSIRLRHDRDILGPLHPAFDFNRRNAHALKLPHVLDQTVVLQTQGVSRRLEPAVAIRKPARLGALAAVSGASSDDGGQVALPRVAHTQRTVDENLNFDGASSANMADLVHRELPRQHDPAAPELCRGDDAL